ncbi:fibronectin type III-like domain-contianing protein [Hymenobacter nivis]|uniref:fibronectin type III-like domain-contianing protein n=1 Tax=Hymenobacter nivis TaxID=1850093 RepID=UPI001B879E92|nr:fibronectin type III-like domain-contianing protein [Hymenobacter nivis]
MAADEAVPLYPTHPPKAGAQTPLCALKGFRCATRQPGGGVQVKFALVPTQLVLIDKGGHAFVPGGPVMVWVGGAQRLAPSARRWGPPGLRRQCSPSSNFLA